MMRFLPPMGYTSAALAVAAVNAVAASAQTACIDTNGTASLVRRTMTIEQQGKPGIAVSGAIVSLDAATGEVAIKASGLDGEQRIKPTLIRLETLPPSMASQMPLPAKTLLGPFTAEFPYTVLRVEQGVLNYPQCTSAATGHTVVFTGTLTFGDGKLKVDGEFADYTLPAGGGGRPGLLGEKPG